MDRSDALSSTRANRAARGDLHGARPEPPPAGTARVTSSHWQRCHRLRWSGEHLQSRLFALRDHMFGTRERSRKITVPENGSAPITPPVVAGSRGLAGMALATMATDAFAE